MKKSTCLEEDMKKLAYMEEVFGEIFEPYREALNIITSRDEGVKKSELLAHLRKKYRLEKYHFVENSDDEILRAIVFYGATKGFVITLEGENLKRGKPVHKEALDFMASKGGEVKKSELLAHLRRKYQKYWLEDSDEKTLKTIIRDLTQEGCRIVSRGETLKVENLFCIEAFDFMFNKGGAVKKSELLAHLRKKYHLEDSDEKILKAITDYVGKQGSILEIGPDGETLRLHEFIFVFATPHELPEKLWWIPGQGFIPREERVSKVEGKGLLRRFFSRAKKVLDETCDRGS